MKSYSKYHKAYLNKEIICLLSSFQEQNIKDILSRYMAKGLEELVNMFESEEIAFANFHFFLRLNSFSFILDRKFSFTKNAHLFKVLKGIYLLRSMELKNKMNIAINDGALLL